MQPSIAQSFPPLINKRIISTHKNYKIVEISYPCLTQNLVLDCDDFTQPGNAHLLPPPCKVQNMVPPTADLLQPSVEHRLPPPRKI